MECLYYIVRKEDNYRASVTAEEDNEAPFRSAQTRGLVPATCPCNWSSEEFTRRDWSQGLVPRTVHTKRFEAQVQQVAGTCPKNSNWFEFVGLVAGTKFDTCD